MRPEVIYNAFVLRAVLISIFLNYRTYSLHIHYHGDFSDWLFSPVMAAHTMEKNDNPLAV